MLDQDITTMHRFRCKLAQPLPIFSYTWYILTFVLMLQICSTSAQEQEKDIVRENYAVQELLQAKCFDCHGVDRQKSGLRLDDRPSALKGGNSGVAGVVPNDPLASAIVQRITLPMEDKQTMPPSGTDRPRLTAEESLQIIHWIYRGAKWPSFQDFEEDQSVSSKSANNKSETENTIEPVVEGDLVSFGKQVLPIFEKNCISCHGPDEQIKGLRLDTVIDIMEANADGFLLVAGSTDDSELFRRVALSEDDPEIMPPSEFGPPLSTAEQEIIAQWIRQGAKFNQSNSLISEDIPAVVSVSPAPVGSLAKLSKMGALATPIAQDTNFIQIDFSQIADDIGDEQLSQLEPFKEQLRWLDVGGTKITDEGISKLVEFTNLTRLHLENTSIGDTGVAYLPTLTNLTYLNMFNTQVSDGGLKHLKLLKKLEQIYLWKTQVTENAAEELMAERPDLTVNIGWEYELKKKLLAHLQEPVEKAVLLSSSGTIDALVNLVSKDELEIAKKIVDAAVEKQTVLEEKAKKASEAYTKLVALFDDGSCCQKAHQDGKKCSHDCCVKAFEQEIVCVKCNPGANDKTVN